MVFFKIRARQLLKSMFNSSELHWIAAVPNPRTRTLKLTTDIERTHAYGLVRTELAKIIGKQLNNDKRSEKPSAITNSSSPPQKKFKSYTSQFNDDSDDESTNITTSSKGVCGELEMYLQIRMLKCTSHNDIDYNRLIFWKEQESSLPNLSKLARKIFCIPASSAAVKRAFSSAGVIISQRGINLNPSTVNDIILVRSAARHRKSQS